MNRILIVEDEEAISGLIAMSLERVWGGEMGPDTRTLDLHINRLRKKLGWHDKITTVYKVGYKLEKEEARR